MHCDIKKEPATWRIAGRHVWVQPLVVASTREPRRAFNACLGKEKKKPNRRISSGVAEAGLS